MRLRKKSKRRSVLRCSVNRIGSDAADRVMKDVRHHVGHPHDEIQACVLQDEIFHESAYVDDSGHVNIAYRRQILVHAGAGTDRAGSELDAAYAGQLA